MKAYGTLSKDELLQLHTQLVKEYEEAKGKGLKLVLTAGITAFWMVFPKRSS